MKVQTYTVTREAYRAWRAQCPAELLSPFSQVAKWLGATPEPSSPASLPKPRFKEIALVEAENEALLALRKELKRNPDFEEFWDYLTDRDETGTVADSTDDRLMWIGKGGGNHETRKSRMRNRLTEAKKRNPFKP